MKASLTIFRHASLIASILVLNFGLLYAQGTNTIINKELDHWIDRFEIKNGELFSDLHTSFKGYQREYLVKSLKKINLDDGKWSAQDRFNWEYFMIDNWEWSDTNLHVSKKPILKHFYKTKPDTYSQDREYLDLHASPVMYLSYGRETADPDVAPFINTRGIEVRGMIGRKVGFYTYMADNQAIFPQYTREYIRRRRVVPSEAFWKDFKTDGVDFFHARGYISFDATEFINLQFGHDRFFIGNGHRSLILSDFSSPFLFLKANTQLWRFSYTNLFTELVAEKNTTPTGSRLGPYPRKYMVFHHLSLNLTKNLNVGIFETIVFGDSTQRFEPDYLNPIIFYRSIEQYGGSTGNAILGLDIKWNLLNRFSLYGQFGLDEFVLSNMLARNGWWANKFVVQGGLKYIDAFGAKNLDLQGEINVVRPYYYTHEDNFKSYTHYLQPLAHPLGANFREAIGIIRYQPIGRVNFTGRAILAQYGLDSAGSNWGSDVLRSYRQRERNFGNVIGQGVATTMLYGDATLSYQWKHNIFLDLRVIYRRVNSELPEFERNTTFTSLAFRWNIPARLLEF